jgi:hypothetical protein
MEGGYSILLGEHLPARAITYDDCAPMQIVCPACYEPVFKGVRNQLETPIHYLSHYAESKAYQAECELRVRSVSETVITSHNTASRDQRLAYFLKRFTDLLERDPYISYQLGFQKIHHGISRAKSIQLFRQLLFNHVVETGLAQSEEIGLEANLYIDDMTTFGAMPKTDFSIVVQKRIARDIFKSIHTQPQRPNHAYLFAHSLLVLHSRFLSSKATDPRSWDDFSARFLSALSGLLSGEEAQVQSSLMDLRHRRVQPPHVSEATYAINFLSIECTHEMVGTLLRLPYFDLLRDFVASERGAPTSRSNPI